MAYERNPDDPYRPNPTEEARRQARLDNELQPDPELAEGPASSGRIAMFAVAIAIVLGAVFYGLNNTTVNQDGASSTAQKTSPAAPGTTTGAAPARPQPSPPANQ